MTGWKWVESQHKFRVWQTEWSRQTDGERERKEGGKAKWAEKEGARAPAWQRVCTAEHKLKKPRPLSHTPLGPKLHGVLHSTHKQPPGKPPGCMRESGGDARLAGKKQQLPFHISTMPPNCKERLWRQAMETGGAWLRTRGFICNIYRGTRPKNETNKFENLTPEVGLVLRFDIPLIISFIILPTGIFPKHV